MTFKSFALATLLLASPTFLHAQTPCGGGWESFKKGLV